MEVNVGRAAVHVNRPALRGPVQKTEEEEEHGADGRTEQHLHHCGYLQVKLNRDILIC